MPKLIIVVDDDKELVQGLQAILKTEKYKLDFAYNGQDFLKKIKKKKPDLVVLDYFMPGLSLKSILEELKKDKKNKNIKIILMTIKRLSEEEEENLFKNFNILDYIRKPFDLGEFIGSINKALK